MGFALSRAKQQPLEYEYMTMDIETDSRNGSALLGEPNYITWCIAGKGYGCLANDTFTLTDWLLGVFLVPEHSGYILYAHNGFGFDYKRINWKRLLKEGFTGDLLTGNDGSIKSISIMKGDSTWILRDTVLLIPMKLSKVTETFSPSYLKIERKFTFDEKPFNPLDPEDVEYAIQDAVALYHAIANVDNLLISYFNISIHSGSTLPSIAFRAFRLTLDKGEKYPGIGFGLAHASRESYHGGQTIAFQTSYFSDVVSIDCNSMYPYVMLNFELPTGKVNRYWGNPGNLDPLKTLCLAVVHIPEGVFPLLKTKDKKGKTGNFNGIVSGWYWMFELEKQKELGGNYEIVECYTWEESTSVVQGFIDKCRQLRFQDYHGAVGAIAKLLGNSLYGKFAQSIAEYIMVLSSVQPREGTPVYDPVTDEFVEGVWYVPGGKSYSADMTHWASFITSMARCVLTDGIQKIGFKEIIYCDTDSLFFERKYIDRVRAILGSEYGKFKIEKGSETKGIHFRAVAPKAYQYTDEKGNITVKNKGIPTYAISRSLDRNYKVSYVQSNNLSQIIKRGSKYGKISARQMATELSTTNGKIIDGRWFPVVCELREINSIRYDKTPVLHKLLYDNIIEEFSRM